MFALPIRRFLHHHQKHYRPLAYIDVFTNDFLGYAKILLHFHRKLRCALLHSIEKVFLPLNVQYYPSLKDLISLKNLDARDFSCSTFQTLLVWLVYNITMTITLPSHCPHGLWDILDSF